MDIEFKGVFVYDQYLKDDRRGYGGKSITDKSENVGSQDQKTHRYIA